MAGPLQVALPETGLAVRIGEGVGRAAPFLVAAAATGLLAADDGGYWPTSWGWAALALAWVAGVALVLRQGRVSRLELGWIGGLGLLTAWTALSFLWTDSRTETALEVERGLVYLLAATAVTAVARSTAYRGLLWGAWTGSTLACLYGLATRLFPERLGVTDALAGYRLSAPIGYWNGLGLLAALAALLALGLATFGRQPATRAVAAASLPLLLPTLYFTFSRGAWIALAAGMLAAALLSPRRLALAAGLLVQALPAAAAIWLAYRAKPLRETDATLASAVHSGHTLAWQLLLLAGIAAALTLGYGFAARRVRVPGAVRIGFAVVLVAALAGGLGALVARYGGPAGVVTHARHSIDSGGPGGGTDLSSRLFSLSSTGRLRQWHVALDEWHANRLLGSGAGTYAQYWAAAGPQQNQLLDVHNLYLETLAELGPVGLVLLAGALVVPLVAAVRARRRSLVPIAAGAYAAWLVHVVYDWDWELPGVTIAALICAGAVLVAARRDGATARRATARWGLLALAAVTGLAALFGLLGNRALARSGDALGAGNLTAALAAADDARRWAPWSSEPWTQIAAVRRLQGDRAAQRLADEHAVAKDPNSWQLWLDLWRVGTPAERARALDRLATLNPGVAASARSVP